VWPTKWLTVSQIACITVAGDGMVVHTQTERVLETRRSIMEFHLINHPLDCPVCDQAGECWLQIYYMRHGLYDPRMADEKVHKPKAIPLGPHVILDAERCILCSRCVRFCDEVTGTGELGIFHRGDHSEIGLFPGKTLENKYASNVIDICPVGALTDRDFRFQVRVWYLDSAKSICNGCARGCNVEIHTSRRRPHHNQGKRVARIKPRENAQVNKWWICDAGRYGFGAVDDPSRLTRPLRGVGAAAEDLAWDEALAEVADLLRRHAGAVGVIASPQLANEDLFALRRLAETLGGVRIGFRVPPAVPGDEDDFLIRADKNPNTRGAELLGLDGDVAAILADARAGRLRALWIFQHDLFDSAWPADEVEGALAGVEALVFTGTNANRTSARAGLVLPAAAWVECDGTFTNFQGRVQRFRAAVETLGEARPVWAILGPLLAAQGADPQASRAAQWFRMLAAAVPAFGEMSYESIGEGGQEIRG
jgi:NADH-quinone oxidoreductase subunit G